MRRTRRLSLKLEGMEPKALARRLAGRRRETMGGLCNIFGPGLGRGKAIAELSAATGIGVSNWSQVSCGFNHITPENMQKLQEALAAKLRAKPSDGILRRAVDMLDLNSLSAPTQDEVTRWAAEALGERPDKAAPRSSRIVGQAPAAGSAPGRRRRSNSQQAVMRPGSMLATRDQSAAAGTILDAVVNAVKEQRVVPLMVGKVGMVVPAGSEVRIRTTEDGRSIIEVQ